MLLNEVDLETPDQHPFRSPVPTQGSRRATAEGGLSIIQRYPHQAVEEPVDASHPLARGAWRGGGACKPIVKDTVLGAEFPRAGSQFHGPPTAVQRVERLLRGGAGEALLLTRQNVAGLHLPGPVRDVPLHEAFL